MDKQAYPIIRSRADAQASQFAHNRTQNLATLASGVVEMKDKIADRVEIELVGYSRVSNGVTRNDNDSQSEVKGAR